MKLLGTCWDAMCTRLVGGNSFAAAEVRYYECLVQTLLRGKMGESKMGDEVIDTQS